jgi:hypothetical protein
MGTCGSGNFIGEYMNRTYSSYSEYKSNYEESKLKYLIHRKYLKILGRFIENTYPGLKFDVFIRDRDPKVKNMQWYGHTYMELRIYDIISLPSYAPQTFTQVYKTPHCDGYIGGEEIYNEIENFIPELNKHLLISFRTLIQPHLEIHNMDMFDVKPFECWGEYFSREYRKEANGYGHYY